MILSFWKKLSLALVVLCLGMMYSVASVQAIAGGVERIETIRCHCWRGTAAQRTTYCISMSVSSGTLCSEFTQATEYSELNHLYPSLTENLHCDNGYISEGDFHAGRGQPGDRCPTTPAPFNLSQLNGATPVERHADVAGTVVGNQTRITNGATQQQVDQARQEAARDYNRTFPNPLPGLTLPKLIGGIVSILVGFVGIFFLVVFVYGSFMYMTAAGDPKQVEKGKDAIKGAVVGLVIVMLSYTAVSLLIDTTSSLMGNAPAPTISQENGTSQLTNNSQPTTPGGGDFATTTADGLQACRNWYAGDPALCPASTCPVGASNLNDLMRIWGGHLPGGNVPASQAACRSCVETGIQNLVGRFPGMDLTCMPAVAGLWNGECSNICIDPNWRTGGQGVGAIVNECLGQSYDLTTLTCTRCLEAGRRAVNASSPTAAQREIRNRIDGQVGCVGDPQGKLLKWCAYGHTGWNGPETDRCVVTPL